MTYKWSSSYKAGGCIECGRIRGTNNLPVRFLPSHGWICYKMDKLIPSRRQVGIAHGHNTKFRKKSSPYSDPSQNPRDLRKASALLYGGPRFCIRKKFIASFLIATVVTFRVRLRLPVRVWKSLCSGVLAYPGHIRAPVPPLRPSGRNSEWLRSGQGRASPSFPG